jgi:hypothetical protein
MLSSYWDAVSRIAVTEQQIQDMKQFLRHEPELIREEADVA